MSHPLFVFVLIPRLLLLPYYCWDHHSSTASTTPTSRSAGRIWLWGWAAQSASLSIIISTHFNDRSADGWLQLVHPWIKMLWWCAGRLREVRGSCSSLIWIWIVPFWNSGQIIEFWISADSGRDFELGCIFCCRSRSTKIQKSFSSSLSHADFGEQDHPPLQYPTRSTLISQKYFSNLKISNLKESQWRFLKPPKHAKMETGELWYVSYRRKNMFSSLLKVTDSNVSVE